jgi:hypothetical protein
MPQKVSQARFVRTGSDVMPVLDMGLDFRSYQHLVDSEGHPWLGNVINFPVEKIADTFEPTLGLLVTMLHFYCQSTTTESARAWLSTYDTIQKLYIENGDNKLENRRHAEDARRAISPALSSGTGGPDSKLSEKLLILLDHQSGIRGLQAPSQRRIPRDPKGTFCNLHLSDHRCNQEFACNQLHLHQAGPVKHRTDFHLKMIEVLTKEGLSHDEILHRLKDSLMFARFGNRVSVRFGSNWVAFFKTTYTRGRLDHALRISTTSCCGRNCRDGQQCLSVHVQDERNLQTMKQLDIPSIEVSTELEAEALQLMTLYQSRGVDDPRRVASPTTEQWQNTVRDYVRQAGIHELRADDLLLQSLEGVKMTTPLNASGTSDALTPLLHEVDMRRFDSSLSQLLDEGR